MYHQELNKLGIGDMAVNHSSSGQELWRTKILSYGSDHMGSTDDPIRFFYFPESDKESVDTRDSDFMIALCRYQERMRGLTAR